MQVARMIYPYNLYLHNINLWFISFAFVVIQGANNGSEFLR